MDIVKYAPWMVPLILAAMIAATAGYHPHRVAQIPVQPTDEPGSR
jgi:hypothetical protein